MTPFAIPQPIQYNDPVNIFASNWRSKPAEGDRVIPMAIDWGNAGANNSVRCNLQQLSTQPFSRIAAIFVDNIQNDVDCLFIFPDANFILRVPAGSAGLYPVVTNSLSFIVLGVGASAGTFTRFQVYNSYPFPVAVAKSDFLQATTGISIFPTTAGTQNIVLIAGPTDGILVGANIGIWGVTGGAAAGTVSLALRDNNGAGKFLALVAISLQAGQIIPSQTLFAQSGMNVPFSNGLNAVVIQTGTQFINSAGAGNAGLMPVNIYTR